MNITMRSLFVYGVQLQGVSSILQREVETQNTNSSPCSAVSQTLTLGNCYDVCWLQQYNSGKNILQIAQTHISGWIHKYLLTSTHTPSSQSHYQRPSLPPGLTFLVRNVYQLLSRMRIADGRPDASGKSRASLGKDILTHGMQ